MNESGKPTTATSRETRRLLIEATLRCLAKDGIAGTSARDIARESGVNLGGIVYHFGSKDELVTRALLEAIREWIEPAIRVLKRDIDPVRRMLLAVKELQRAFDEAQELLPAYLEALVSSHRNPTLAAGIRELMGELHGFVSAQIAELQKRKILPKWVDPDAMATLQIAAADGLALHSTLSLGGVESSRVARQAARLLIAARKPERKDARRR